MTTTNKPVVQISATLFWQLHSTLINLDNLLDNLHGVWDEDSKQGCDITNAHMEVGTMIGKMEAIVNTLKDLDTNANWRKETTQEESL